MVRGEWHPLHLQPKLAEGNGLKAIYLRDLLTGGTSYVQITVTSTSNNPISLAGLPITVTAFSGSVPSTAKLRICADGAGNVAFETQVTLNRVKDVVTFTL